MKRTPIFEQSHRDDTVDIFFRATRPPVQDIYASKEEISERNAAFERYFRLRSLDPTWATTYAAIYTQFVNERLASDSPEADVELLQAS